MFAAQCNSLMHSTKQMLAGPQLCSRCTKMPSLHLIGALENSCLCWYPLGQLTVLQEAVL